MTNIPSRPESLDVTRVAQVLGCHRNTVYNLIKAGDLPAFYVGTRVRITVADLVAYRQRQSYATKKKVHP